MNAPTPLTLAHSPDPDDVFMWWPITGMIDPPKDPQRIEPSRVISAPEIDTGRFSFTSIASDIAALNRHAIAGGELDVTALSMFAWANVRERYTLTSFGSSFGEGYGPKIVGKAGTDFASLTRRGGHAVIAVPGLKTTAFALLSMMLGEARQTLRAIEMPFDQILDAVASGQSGVTHGLLIHQSQLTFADAGLTLIADTGEWWRARTGLPLPLGGNAVSTRLDARFGPGSTQEVVNTLWASLSHAMQHRDRSIEYCMRFAPELSRQQAERYIRMYVSPLTIDAAATGLAAVQRLLDDSSAIGLVPAVGTVKMLRPTSP